MDVEVLKSYLVDLGFEVNQSQLRKFDAALKEAATSVASHTSGMLGGVLKWQTAIVSGFASVATGVVAMADHVAMADQKYRLLGLQMHVSTEAARKLSIGMDALGASMDEITWDPELNRNFLQLAEDQDVMLEKLGAGYQDNLRDLRDIRLEFKRLQVALTEYLPLFLIKEVFSQFGLSIADVHEKLEGFVTTVRDHMPEIASGVGSVLVPVLQDAWDVLKGLGHALAAVAVAFTNLVGALTGDKTIEGAAFDFGKFGSAVLHVADLLADVANLIDSIIERTAHLASGISAIFSGKWKVANDEGNAIFAPLPELEERRRKRRQQQQSGGGQSPTSPAATGPIADQVRDAATHAGIDPNLALAVGMQESGLRQYDTSGNIVSPGTTSAKGIFQLTDAAAKDQHVDARDTAQNIQGGVNMLRSLLQKYHGSQEQALAAYYWGPGNVDNAMRTGAGLPPEVLAYVHGVMSKEQGITVGDVQINITQPGATAAEIHDATQTAMTAALRRQAMQQQRTIAQAQVG
jgi:hypothetical protein